MGLMTNRKGVSPLVATVLLIALSVGMGVAVMSWGEDYIEGHAEFVQGGQEVPSTCDVVDFSVIEVGGESQLCQEGGIIKSLIENGPDANINDFHVRAVGEGGLFVQDGVLVDFLPLGSATPVSFRVGDIGMVKQIKFTPSIMIADEKVLCTKQAVIIEDIRVC